MDLTNLEYPWWKERKLYGSSNKDGKNHLFLSFGFCFKTVVKALEKQGTKNKSGYGSSSI